MKKLTVFIIALVFLFAACTNPSSNTPTVNSISITSPNESLTNNEVTLFLGENIELTAIVDVSYEASTAVEWSVTGWSYPELGEDEPETAELEAGTGVSPEDENTTTLTINENEKADFLIVTATSVFNPDKFESVKVHIDHTVTEITGVTIEPNEDVSVFIFGELQFTATVEGTGRLSQTVTWTIDEAGENGKTTAGTEIDDDGLLTVSGTEELEELTIRATSVGPEHKWASVKVTIKTPKVSSLTIFTKPLGLENVDQGGSIEFDFNLVFEEYGFPPEISEDVTWLVVRENNQDTAAGTKFRENTSILDVDEEEALGRLIITATSVYDTSKVSAPINLTVREISPIHIVNSVKIINIPKDVEVLKGATHQFTHLVDASGPLPLPPNIGFVNWNLTGNTSITTTIVNGLLTVAPDEEGPILAITVTSTFEGDGGGLSDTATVTIPAKRTLPNPDAVMLNNQGVATWTASSPETFVEKYILQLYKGAEPVGDKTEVNKGQNYSVPFISEMRKGAGTYTFKITAATTDTINFDDSAEVESNSQTVRQRTPADNLSWDGDKATWSAGGGDIIGGNFRVKLYKGGTPVVDGEHNTGTQTEYNFTGDLAELGVGSYTFTVTAIGDNFLILGAAESGPSSPNVKEPVVLPLPPPTNVVLDNQGIATWTASDPETNVKEYSVQLIHGVNGNVGQPVIRTKGNYSVPFIEEMQKATGFYTVVVTAIPEDAFNSATPSEPSGEQEVTQRNLVTNLWWLDGSPTARWVNPDNVGDYTIQLIRDGSDVGDPLPAPRQSTVNPGNTQETVTSFEFNWDGVTIEFNNEFTFRVIALGRNQLELDSTPRVSGANTVTQRNPVTNIWWHDGSTTARWINPDDSGDYTIQLLKDGVAEGQSFNAPRQNTHNNWDQGVERTRTEFDFTPFLQTVDSSAQYSFEVIALGRNVLELGSIPATANARNHFTVFGDARVWTIVEGGTGENKRYVAGADNGRIAWSSDGVTWTLASQGATPTTIFGTNAVRGIAHNGASPGRFVAVGHAGRIAFSDDGGKTWSNAGVTDFGSTSMLTIAHGLHNGTDYFVAGGDNRTVRYSSDNGITWQNATTDDLGGTDRTVLSILYGNDRFLVFTENPGQYGWFNIEHPNGISWLGNNISNANRILAGSGAFGNGVFIVPLNSNTNLPRLPSGVWNNDNWQWSDHRIGANNIRSVGFGQGKFIAVGLYGNASISNDNGANWTLIANRPDRNWELTASLGTATGAILAGPGSIAFVLTP